MFKNYRGLKKIALGAMILVTTMGLSLPVSASLIGDTITITTTANAPLDTWEDDVVVGAGIELTAGDGSNHALPGPFFPHLFTPGDSIDIGESSITMNFTALDAVGFPYAFSSIFSDLDWTDMPGSLQSVAVASGATGLLAFNISGVVDTGFTFQGTVDLVNGANFTLDLTAIHDTPALVPVPAAFWLFGTALIGLVGFSKRRQTA